MQNALNRLRDVWLNTSRANQTLLIAIVGIAALVGIGFVYWASTPDYQTLVSNASAASAGKITAMLDQQKVNYKIVNEGTIQVPAAEAAKLRMKLAQDGLLESGSGGDAILDSTNIMMTDAVEKEKIRRAHEGEMEKSIRTLEPVSEARVHLATGSQDAFVDPDKKEASASIIVHLKPGHELSKENVNAIVSLVQSGYQNLSRKNINLVTGEGHLLFNGAEMSSGTSSSEERQSQERQAATDLTALIRAQLMPLGQDRFQVAVRVKLNLDRENTSKRTPLPGVKVSTTNAEETLSGEKLSVNRPTPGLGSNVNGGPNAPTTPVPGVANAGGANNGPNTYEARTGGDGQPGKYSNSTTSSTIQPGEEVTNVVKSPGETKQVSVSVLLDADKVTLEQAAVVKQQVQNIVNGEVASSANPPNVVVDRFKFDNSAALKEKQDQEVAAAAERTNRIVGYAVPFGLMVMMLVILARSLRRHGPRAGQLALAGGGMGSMGGIPGMGNMGGMQPALAGAAYGSGYTGGGGLNMLVGDEVIQGMSVEEALDAEGRIIPISKGDNIHTYEVISEQFDSNLESILHLARSKPEMVARLVKSWIVEEAGTRK